LWQIDWASAARGEYLIMSKVRLADVVSVKKGLSGAARQQAFNRIQSKHLDFVICKPDDSTILFAVELDDQSHNRADRKDRDAFVDEVLKAAGITLHRVTAKRAYSVQDLRDALLSTPQPVQATSLVPPAPAAAQAPAPAVSNPTCPSCGVPMVMRTAKSGSNAGNSFWGCPNYPKCRQIVAA
jgi:very-short-patch-repair endonuclease